MDKHLSACKHNAETPWADQSQKATPCYWQEMSGRKPWNGKIRYQEDAQRQQERSRPLKWSSKQMSWCWDLTHSEEGGHPRHLPGSQASSTRPLGCPGWGAGQVSSRMVETFAGWGAAETTYGSIRAACHLHKTKRTAASVREKGTADAVQIMSSTAWQRAAFE